MDFMTPQWIATKKDERMTAEIDQNGMTRFILDGAVLPMRSMDNYNPVFARQYLEFRGWKIEKMEAK